MKALFAHDHIFFKHKGVFYSNGGLSRKVLSRYTDVFQELKVISRQKSIDYHNNELSLASNKNTSFVKVPDFKKLNKINKLNEAKKIIYNAVLDCDCLIARLPSLIGNTAIKYAVQLNKPYLIELVGDPWDSNWNHSIKGKILAPIEYRITKSRVYNSSYTIYVTKEYLQKKYPTKGLSTNCSNVSINSSDTDVLNSRFKKINSLPNNPKLVIGTIGAVNIKYKGQQHVIEALGKLKKEGITNFEYQLVGRGNQNYLKKIAKQNNVVEQVNFIGSLEHSKVLEWLEGIDIYVQPSETEGLPRSLIEAMSKGVLAIGSNAGGIPELLDNKYIYNKDGNNSQKIATLITSLNKITLKEQADKNFMEAKKYDKKIIEDRRKKFLKKFYNDQMK